MTAEKSFEAFRSKNFSLKILQSNKKTCQRTSKNLGMHRIKPYIQQQLIKVKEQVTNQSHGHDSTTKKIKS